MGPGPSRPSRFCVIVLACIAAGLGSGCRGHRHAGAPVDHADDALGYDSGSSSDSSGSSDGGGTYENDSGGYDDYDDGGGYEDDYDDYDPGDY